MQKVYEMDTWRGAYELNEIAIAAAKKYKGEKFNVAIGEWGTKTYLVFADSKEEAKQLALDEYSKSSNKALYDNKIKVRNVTNCKKYN